jgi:hypothetical protein
MHSLNDLHRSVQTTLASRRMGTPVFVRYLLHRAARGEAVLAHVVRIAAVVRGWLGAPVQDVYALGSPDQRHLTLTLEFRNGTTALLTWIGTTGRGAGIDLTVLGSRGALYHDAGDADLWDEAPALGEEPPDGELLALVERAVRSGRRETAGGNP